MTLKVNSCIETGRCTEADLVRHYYWKDRPQDFCAGGLLCRTLSAEQTRLIDANLGSSTARAVFWRGNRWLGTLTFMLCGLHWMDLASSLGSGALRTGDLDATDEAVSLVCYTADRVGWDKKEIANMMKWRQVQLT